MLRTLEVAEGLPPGLWLPTAQEATDQYLRETFNRPDRDYGDIVDYGGFVVALAALDGDRKSSLMPTYNDLQELFAQGYGIHPTGYLHQPYGGVGRLQRTLGFYPRGYHPAQAELTERFIWIKEYAFPLAEGEEALESATLDQLILWGAARRLAPSPVIVRRVFNSDTTPLRRLLGIERKNTGGKDPRTRYFRFGAKVVRDNDGPVSQAELNLLYPDDFSTTPYKAIVSEFGTIESFWSEFDYIVMAKTLNRDQLISLGVRWAIANNGKVVSTVDINQLSSQKRFPSRGPIVRDFDSISRYREAVREAYEQFAAIGKELEAAGVSQKVVALAGRSYEKTDAFNRSLFANTDCLVKLSTDSPTASYVQKLIESGFDYFDEAIFEFQCLDLQNCLKRLGIIERDEINFVLSLMPRIDPAEILAVTGSRLSKPKLGEQSRRSSAAKS